MADDFQTHNQQEQKHQQALNEFDFNHAISGEETGRIGHSSLAKANQEHIEQKKKREAEQALLTGIALQQFNEKWQAVSDKLAHAQTAVYEAICELQDDIKDLTDNAARTADGRLVFLDENGVPVFEDGQPLTPDEIADTTGLDSESTRIEDYRAKQDALKRMLDHDQRLIEITDKMDEMKNNPTDGDQKILDDLERHITTIRNDISEMSIDQKLESSFEVIIPTNTPELNF